MKQWRVLRTVRGPSRGYQLPDQVLLLLALQEAHCTENRDLSAIMQIAVSIEVSFVSGTDYVLLFARMYALFKCPT